MILRPDQIRASEKLRKMQRGFLLGKMGSGKTLTACDALAHILPDERASVWVVSTPAVIAQWSAPLTACGIRSERYKKGAQPRAQVLLLTFGELASAIECVRQNGRKKYVYHAPPPQVLIIDESRKIAGLRLRGGSEQGRKCAVAATSARVLWLLTAAPHVDSILDAWAQLYLIDKSAGATLGEFIGRYCQYATHDIDRRKPLAQPGAVDKINALIAARSIALTSPLVETPAEVITHTCTIDEPGMRVYAQLKRTKTIAGRATNSAAHVFGLCHQLASGVAYLPAINKQTREEIRVNCSKPEKLRELVSALINDSENVVISYVYEHQRRDILAAVEGLAPAEQITTLKCMGGKSKTIDAWNAGRIRVALAHPKSLGHGVNLQSGGRCLIVYSEHFSADSHTQMLERLGALRQQLSGTGKIARVVYLRTAGTLDMLIPEVRDGKLTMQEALEKIIY